MKNFKSFSGSFLEYILKYTFVSLIIHFPNTLLLIFTFYSISLHLLQIKKIKIKSYKIKRELIFKKINRKSEITINMNEMR